MKAHFRAAAATKPLRSGQPCPETHALPVKTLARLPNKTPLQLHALAAKDNGNLYDPAEFMCTRRMACMGRVGGIDGARFDEFVRVVESYSLMTCSANSRRWSKSHLKALQPCRRAEYYSSVTLYTCDILFVDLKMLLTSIVQSIIDIVASQPSIIVHSIVIQ
ncbi:hypothetical protein BC936DRAFT_143649 [Jimgerdemannia flammicorona]|uniref:Uncharacterized protein n=1 Tax=Jimgerdemannia flammicorona TaxID=994334 RepID=A0A433DDJ6_9FUNG|nr:hypothetical protein BC936DRAFT_143649 [Jimgerdemannia flammicorona]